MLAREKWQIKTLRALEMVFEERIRQEAQYGHVNDSLEDGTGPEARWLEPFSDWPADDVQVGFRQEYEKYEKDNGLPTWSRLIREEVAEAFELAGDDPRFVEEILQVAALCVSWAERKMA